MAIDTKEKRASVIGVGRPYLRDKFPIAAPDQEWRVSSGLAYGGNALASIITTIVVGLSSEINKAFRLRNLWIEVDTDDA